ncbi:nucleotidyltransferase domain-containing protein [Pseudoalteromonas galatheae]|uniref:nucleotidyltransferase domain-containing protein n=1 Tax=Pseudoalteromonas galatheae TaxID=579562 RepID=UPI0030CE70E0
MPELFTNARALSEQKKSMLVEMIGSVFDNLDLTQTQQERIEEAYNAVGNYLAGCDNPLLNGARIYPQGSMRLRTTNKPLSQEEFDVDLILFLPNAVDSPRDEIVQVVKQHLLNHKVYKELLEDLPRGFRINYKGDYHLDITPAKAYELEVLPGHPLWVIDKHTGFKESNPEGMADTFDKACAKLPKIQKRRSRLKALSNKSVAELPDQSQKKPLNRIVQILKRHRDVWSQSEISTHANFKPISVIITTLASKAYLEVINSEREYENELDLILDVIELMPCHIELVCNEVLITNPTMKPENYAEKWNREDKQEGEKYRKAFFAWYQAAVDTFEHLAHENKQGLDNVFIALSNSFGEKPVLAAKKQYLESINSSRGSGNLGVVLNSGTIARAVTGRTSTDHQTASYIAQVKRNQFYGD